MDQVKGRKKKRPLKSPSPVKQLYPVIATITTIAEATIPVNNTAAPKDIIQTRKKKKNKKQHTPEEQPDEIEMETFNRIEPSPSSSPVYPRTRSA